MATPRNPDTCPDVGLAMKYGSIMMMKQTSAASAEIHELTVAEIARQVNALAGRRQQIVNERASTYAHALKNGGGGDSPLVDADERAAREHAKTLLNGSAPASLSLPPDITRDKVLYREQRGIDIALKILGDKGLVARAAAAVEWAEANADEWRQIARDTVLTAMRLDELERRAASLLDQCIDITAVNLPMANLLGGRPISETPVSDLIEIALAKGVVTPAEIRKAKNVG
jgi:hypothetical protein